MTKRKTDLLDELFRMRDEWRGHMSEALTLVKEKDLLWENNRHGKMKWYLHPALTNRAMRSLVVFVQEISPSGHTGKQKHQGGLVHYILEGRGYTVLNDTRHEWEEGDCVVLPIFPNGVEYQHFNSDTERPVRFIAAQPNLFDLVGVDMGCGFEQLEDSPDYQPERRK